LNSDDFTYPYQTKVKKSSLNVFKKCLKSIKRPLCEPKYEKKEEKTSYAFNYQCKLRKARLKLNPQS